MGNRSKKVLQAAIAYVVIAHGVLPIVYHYVEAAQVETELYDVIRYNRSKDEEQLREKILAALAKREILIRPEHLRVIADEGTSEIHLSLEYTRDVEILFFFRRSFTVEIERLALNFGI